MLPTHKEEPVAYAGILQALASVIVAFAAKYALHLDATEVAGVLGTISLAVIPLLRRLVHPAAKVQTQLRAAHAAGAAGQGLPS